MVCNDVAPHSATKASHADRFGSTSSEPLVTVVMPTYNRPEYFEIALDSVLGQDYERLEVIVADNGSDLPVKPILDQYADPRVVYLRSEHNLGMLPNVQRAWQAASGDFIATLEDDDRWHSSFVSTLLPPLVAQPELTLAFSDHTIMRSDGRIDAVATSSNTRRWGRDVLKQGVYRPFIEQALITKAVSVNIAALLRRDRFDVQRIPGGIGDAYDYWMAYLGCRDGAGGYYHPGHLADFRVHATQQRARIDRVLASAHADFACYQHFVKDPRLDEYRSTLEHEGAKAQTWLGICLLRAGLADEATAHLRAGFRRAPSVWSWGALACGSLPGQLATALTRRL